MSRVLLAFGLAFVALGAACYVAVDRSHPTALIPSCYGLLLLAFAAASPWSRIVRIIATLVTVGAFTAVAYIGYAAAAAVLFDPAPGRIALITRWCQLAMTLLSLLGAIACLRALAVERRNRRSVERSTP